MSKYIDLHIHSTYSDGILSVEQIIQEAKKNDAKYIAVTDHDIVDGSIELMQLLEAEDEICGIPGVELTTVYYWKNRKVKIHLLGYNIDVCNKAFKDYLFNKRETRRKQNVSYVKKMLKECAINDFSILEAIDFSKHAYLKKVVLNYFTPQHIEFSKIAKYLDNQPVKYQDYDFEICEAIEMIHRVGGNAVFAHPYQTKQSKSDLDEIVADLVEMGLDGIETVYGRASQDDNTYAEYLANKYKLLKTCGSDFHTYVYENYIAFGKNRNMCIDHCSYVDWLKKSDG